MKKTIPLFPTPTEWLAPEVFPNLSTAKEIAIDLETCDPNLESMGPGWPRNDGFVVGYAIAVDGWSGYFPVAHQGGGNLDKRRVERWIADVLAYPSDKVMHNAAYDLGWLQASGFKVNGRIVDTMLAAPILDENRFSYALNSLGFDYLQEAKSEQGLKQAAADFGVHPKKELWKLPAMYVGEYAEQDAALTLKLWQAFKIRMRQDEVESISDVLLDAVAVLASDTDSEIVCKTRGHDNRVFRPPVVVATLVHVVEGSHEDQLVLAAGQQFDLRSVVEATPAREMLTYERQDLFPEFKRCHSDSGHRPRSHAMVSTHLLGQESVEPHHSPF